MAVNPEHDWDNPGYEQLLPHPSSCIGGGGGGGRRREEEAEEEHQYRW